LKQRAYTRRHIVKTLLALGAGGVSLSYWRSAAAAGGSIMTAIDEALAPEKPTLEVFTEVSKLVTLRDALDAETCKRMYAVFLDEPWGPEHILRLYEKISAALKHGVDKRKRPSLKAAAWDFDDGEKWFASHLLTTWYLGVYYHEERPTQRVAYETALMFEPTRGLLPVPFVDALGYGAWQERPEPAP
jgi:hypothetical protein